MVNKQKCPTTTEIWKSSQRLSFVSPSFSFSVHKIRLRDKKNGDLDRLKNAVKSILPRTAPCSSNCGHDKNAAQQLMLHFWYPSKYHQQEWSFTLRTESYSSTVHQYYVEQSVKMSRFLRDLHTVHLTNIMVFNQMLLFYSSIFIAKQTFKNLINGFVF